MNLNKPRLLSNNFFISPAMLGHATPGRFSHTISRKRFLSIGFLDLGDEPAELSPLVLPIAISFDTLSRFLWLFTTSSRSYAFPCSLWSTERNCSLKRGSIAVVTIYCACAPTWCWGHSGKRNVHDLKSEVLALSSVLLGLLYQLWRGIFSTCTYGELPKIECKIPSSYLVWAWRKAVEDLETFNYLPLIRRNGREFIVVSQI